MLPQTMTVFGPGPKNFTGFGFLDTFYFGVMTHVDMYYLAFSAGAKSFCCSPSVSLAHLSG